MNSTNCTLCFIHFGKIGLNTQIPKSTVPRPSVEGMISFKPINEIIAKETYVLCTGIVGLGKRFTAASL